jgi:hypothetical protein
MSDAEPDATERLKLLAWAIGRSDTLRNAYAARGSIVLAAAGSIAAGIVIFIKPDNVAIVRQYTAPTVVWLTALLVGILWCTGRAIWHVVRATTAVSQQRDHISYRGAKRLWLNADDTIGTSIEREGLILKALFPFKQREIVLPPLEELSVLSKATVEQLTAGFIGDLVFILAVQSRRYQRLGWSVVSVAAAFVLYLVFLATWVVLMYRAT